MKKALFLLMLGAAVAFSSCQKDDLDAGTSADQVSVTITAQAPIKNLETRANPAGLKYTLAVFFENNQVARYTNTDGLFNDVRLVAAQPYTIVCWADYDKGYYDISDFTAVSLTSASYAGNDAQRDAFFGKEDVQITSTSDITMTLSRPFGRVNIKTTDYDQVVPASLKPEKVAISYTSIPTAINLFTGAVSADAAVEFTTVAIVGTGDKDISFDYIFAPNAESTLADFKVEFLKADESVVVASVLNAIPVKRNFRTNISGNFLTKRGNITIEVDDNFDGPDYEVLHGVYDIDGLNDMLDNNMSGDAIEAVIVPVTDNATITIPASATVTTNPEYYFEFEGIATGKTITINAPDSYDGVINLRTPADCAGNIVINAKGAEVSINGKVAEFTAAVSDNSLVVEKATVIGKLNMNAGKVLVHGTIEDFGTIASGSKVIFGIDSFERLVEVVGIYNTAPGMYGDYADGVILTSDITMRAVNSTSLGEIQIGSFYDPSVRSEFVFDGGGHTISGNVYSATSVEKNLLVVNADGVTVKNLTLTNTARNGMTISNAQDVIVDNVRFVNNAGGGMFVIGASTVTASNIYSEGNGWYGLQVGKGTSSTGDPVLTLTGVNEINDAIQITAENSIAPYAVSENWLVSTQFKRVAEIRNGGRPMMIWSDRDGMVCEEDDHAVVAAGHTGGSVLFDGQWHDNGFATIEEALQASDINVVKISAGTWNDAIVVPAGKTIMGMDGTILDGTIYMNAGAKAMNFVHNYEGNGGASSKFPIYVAGDGATIENVVFNGVAKTTDDQNGECVELAAGVKNTTIDGCEFYGYWKGVYVNTSDGFTLKNSTFENMNIFSTDHVFTNITVEGNTFRRPGYASTWNLIHLAAVANTDSILPDANTDNWDPAAVAMINRFITENNWVSTDSEYGDDYLIGIRVTTEDNDNVYIYEVIQ